MNKLIERVKAILVNPKATWEVIKAEPASVVQIYTDYLVILAAIPAVAMLIGQSLIGVNTGLVSYRVPIGSALAAAVLSYVLTLAGAFIAGKVIDMLAPTFGTAKNGLNAFKVAAYAYTPMFVAGILGIIPALSVVGLLAGLYGIYLLYLGLQSVMGCPAEKAVGYTIVSIVAMAAVYIVIGMIVAAVFGVGGIGMHGMTRSSRGGADMSAATRFNLARHGVQADVSADGGQMSIETKEGKTTVSTGGNAKIPATFPKDVYVYPGATIQMAGTVPNGWHLSLQSKDSADKVVEAFKAKMTADGWKEAMAQEQGSGQTMVVYQKAKRSATAIIAPSGKVTEINLMVAEDKNASTDN